MSRRLLVINVALGIVSVVLAVGIFRTLLAKRPLPPPPPPRAVSAPAPAAAAGDVEAASGGPGAYGVISAQTLFNPSRSETAAVAVAAAASPVAKPILYGVVVDGTKSRAFLEDPAFKRVAGYSVGDTVGGGTIQKIADDRVIIVRPEGPVEILLQDPSKPRAAPAATAAQAGQPQAGQPQTGPAQVGQPQVGQPQVGPAQAGSPPNPGLPAVPRGRQRIPLESQPAR